jgi:hypothetical protein
MKKKLNLFCVLILVLKAAQIIIGNVMSFGENAQAFKEGWEDGGKAEANSGDLLIGILGIACIFLIIRSLIAFVRFILNVNRDKVFVWENVPLLRWTGWGLLTATAIIAIHDLLEHIPVERIYNNSIDDFIFSVFCLIMAEVFIIGLKLKEEQDLTI